jgi:flavodoxin I
MKKILIVYGSTMGNTEKLAEKIITELKSEGIDIISKNVTDATIDDFSDYNILLFGSSTWGDGDLQDDFADFIPKLESADLKGKKGAVFGPGDSNYDKFCEAVTIIEDTVKNCGLDLYVNGLKIDGEIDDSEDLIHEWVHNLRLSIMND